MNINITRWYFGVWLMTVGLLVNGNELQVVDAAENGDLDAVISLVESGADVNLPLADGTTALAYAAYRNDLNMVEYLLRKAEAEVDKANDYAVTPLYMAAANADAALIEMLLKAGANPNACLLSGETPLMVAANRGRLNEVRILLKYGADPDAKESIGGQTALMWAVAERHPEVVKLLVEYKADVNAASNSGFTPLLFASRLGEVEISQSLLDAGANVGDEMFKTGLTPLMVASIGGFEKLAKLLLDHGANPNHIDKSGKAVLHHAVGNPFSVGIVKALLAKGADPNVRLRNPKPRGGGGYVLRVSTQDATPLLLAADDTNLGAVKVLLEAGADPFITTDQNTTALMMAAGVAIGPSRSSSDDAIATPANEIAKLLVKLGADVNARGVFGWTALHAAAYQGRNEVIKFLILNGANPNIMDEFGQTPLSISYAIVTEEIGDHFDQTPRIYRKDTADLLLSLGATPLEASGVNVVSQRASK